MGAAVVRIARNTLIGLIAAVSMFSAAEANAADGFFGVLPQETMSPAEMATAKAGGIESLRLPLSRNLVTEKSGYDWSAADTFIGNAAMAGLTVLPTIYGTSSWENPDPNWLPNTPEGFAKWDEFLQIAVDRYGTDGSFWRTHPSVPRKPITVWQIWNEVNTIWFSPSFNPGDYADLVIRSSRTIKTADPEAKILLAGMLATPSPETGMMADTFVKKLYRTDGFEQSFDYAAIHPYEVEISDTLGDIVKLRSVLDASGDPNKKIYVTEMGWGSDSKTVFGAGSQLGQARFLTAAYRAIIYARPALKIHAVYWYTWKDLTSGLKSCTYCYENGLFDQTGGRKAAWDALVKVMQRERTNPGDPGPIDPVALSAELTGRLPDAAGSGSSGSRCRKFEGVARKRCRKLVRCKQQKGQAWSSCCRLRFTPKAQELCLKRARRLTSASRKGGQ